LNCSSAGAERHPAVPAGAFPRDDKPRQGSGPQGKNLSGEFTTYDQDPPNRRAKSIGAGNREGAGGVISSPPSGLVPARHALCTEARRRNHRRIASTLFTPLPDPGCRVHMRLPTSLLPLERVPCMHASTSARMAARVFLKVRLRGRMRRPYRDAKEFADGAVGTRVEHRPTLNPAGKPAAEALLHQYGGLTNLAQASFDELQNVKGIGKSKAAAVKSAFPAGPTPQQGGVSGVAAAGHAGAGRGLCCGKTTGSIRWRTSRWCF